LFVKHKIENVRAQSQWYKGIGKLARKVLFQSRETWNLFLLNWYIVQKKHPEKTSQSTTTTFFSPSFYSIALQQQAQTLNDLFKIKSACFALYNFTMQVKFKNQNHHLLFLISKIIRLLPIYSEQQELLFILAQDYFQVTKEDVSKIQCIIEKREEHFKMISVIIQFFHKKIGFIILNYVFS
jgi:hypothetical protein